MRLISLVLLVILITPALSQAQNVVGTCDQYNASSLAGFACLSNGTVSAWYKLHGDVSLLTNSGQCSQSNGSGCGLATVGGINGIPLSGTLLPGQAYCLNSAGTQMMPCGSGGPIVSILPCGATVTITSDGTNSTQLEYVQLCSNVTTLNGPPASALVDGKIIMVDFLQPVGGFAYTIPSCITPPGGYQMNVADTGVGSSPSGHIGACPSPGALPGMSTADLANLELDLHYRATQPAGGTPELVVISAARH